MAYSNNPRGNPRDAVRLLVGDVSTSTGAEQLSDVDYDFFVAQTPNTYSAAALAANSLAARFAVDGTEKQVGDLRIKRAQAAEYRDLAKQFTHMSALVGAGPFAGGLTVSGKRAQTQDSDRVKPWAARDLFDNPAAVEPSASTRNTDGL